MNDFVLEDFMDAQPVFGWHIAERGIGGWDRQEELTAEVSEDDRKLLTDYVRENRERVIPMTELEKLCPDVFNSLEAADGDMACDYQEFDPMLKHSFGVEMTGTIVEDAFDGIKDFEPCGNISAEEKALGRTAPGARNEQGNPKGGEMESMLYTKKADSWEEYSEMPFHLLLTDTEAALLCNCIITGRNRMISIKEMERLAPEAYRTIDSDVEEWSDENLSDSEKANIYIGLSGKVLDCAFDRIFGTEVI